MVTGQFKIYFTLFYTYGHVAAEYCVRTFFKFILKMKRTSSSYGPIRHKTPRVVYASTARRALRKNGETKIFHNAVDTTVTSAGGFLVLGGVAEGADKNQRVGRKLTPLTLKMMGTVVGESLGVSNQKIRLTLIRVIGKWSGTVTDYLTALNDPVNRDRCHVMFDEAVTLDNLKNIEIDLNRRFKLRASEPLKFLGTGAGDDSDGQYVLLWFSDIVAANFPQIRMISDLFYKDV